MAKAGLRARRKGVVARRVWSHDCDLESTRVMGLGK